MATQAGPGRWVVACAVGRGKVEILSRSGTVAVADKLVRLIRPGLGCGKQ